MITNFDDITFDLTEQEKKLIPILIEALSYKTKENPVKAPAIINGINLKKEKYGFKRKLTEPRLRKMCNFIRTNGLLPLIATSNGYYVSHDQKEILAQIDSLTERAQSILGSANGLKKFLK